MASFIRASCWIVLLLCSAGCAESPPRSSSSPDASARAAAFLDTLQQRTFHYFWDLSDPETGLTPDRAPTRSFASVAAVGFALTAYCVGAERGFVDRQSAAGRALTTLRFFRDSPQSANAGGSTGYKGFYYHFLEPETGHRFRDVELSTVDTALLLAGAFACQAYFDRPAAAEDSIRGIVDQLYRRVDWRWAQPRSPLIVHGWDPESGFLPYDWGGYNEAMLVYLLAMASPTHPVEPGAWKAWEAGYRWGSFQGYEHLGFAPLFGHQYSAVWIDFRGIRDGYMRDRGIDYFENGRRAVLAQRAYAIENPLDYAGYGPTLWGLSACDGPVSGEYEIEGRRRRFETYWARGASFTEVQDDGTICPPALAGALPFAPEAVLPALVAIRDRYGSRIFSKYGFLDALNPTFTLDVPVQHGRVDGGMGWFDTDYIGIDQGPVVAMIENHRSGLIWETMKRSPHIVEGLKRAGFTGGWLDSLGIGR